jgi:hypothetical protein
MIQVSYSKGGGGGGKVNHVHFSLMYVKYSWFCSGILLMTNATTVSQVAFRLFIYASFTKPAYF